MANKNVKHSPQKKLDNVSMNLQERINYLFKQHPDKKAIQLAQFAGVSRGAVSDWRKGNVKSITAENAFKVAKFFNVDSEWVATGKGTPEKKKSKSESQPSYTLGGFDLWDENTPLDDDEVALPFFREVELSAGPGICEVQENHGLKLRFAKSSLKKQGVQFEYAACVTVSGNSMEPVLPDGCVVGIDTGNKTVKNGDWYAINHNGHLRVKVLYTLPAGGYRLRSFNIDEYPDETVQFEDIVILGRVFWWSGLR